MSTIIDKNQIQILKLKGAKITSHKQSMYKSF